LCCVQLVALGLIWRNKLTWRAAFALTTLPFKFIGLSLYRSHGNSNPASRLYCCLAGVGGLLLPVMAESNRE
jgi:hypothetical protein